MTLCTVWISAVTGAGQATPGGRPHVTAAVFWPHHGVTRPRNLDTRVTRDGETVTVTLAALRDKMARYRPRLAALSAPSPLSRHRTNFLKLTRKQTHCIEPR